MRTIDQVLFADLIDYAGLSPLPTAGSFRGFLNLPAATALAGRGASAARLVAVIEETDPAAFAITATGLRWRDTGVTMAGLGRAREQFAAFGSRSFDEPVADLMALGMVKTS